MKHPNEPTIAHIFYDEEAQLLEVTPAKVAGRLNWTARYNQVPAPLYEAFMQAEFPYRYLQTELAKYYSFSHGPLKSSMSQAEKLKFVREAQAKEDEKARD